MATGMYERERELTAAITPAVERRCPVSRCSPSSSWPRSLLRLRRPPRGRRPRALRARDAAARRLPRRLHDRRLVARARAAAPPARSTSAAPSGGTVQAARRRARSAFAGRCSRPPTTPSIVVGRTATELEIPVGEIVRGNLIDEGSERMSQEIIEGIRTIEREKGIETGTLVAALEDALLAAYKKTPGASRHAEVELDDEGEFRVFSIEIPGDLEERLVDEARERAIDELERIEEETGEKQHTLVIDDELELDWSQVPEDLMDRERRDAGRLRAHRRDDRQAGHPAAHPRGRARDDVRRVHRPAGRGRDRHRPAGRRPQQRARRPRARSRRCCRAPSRSTASATSRARASRP